MNICQTHVSFGPFLNSNKPARVTLKDSDSVSVDCYTVSEILFPFVHVSKSCVPRVRSTYTYTHIS